MDLAKKLVALMVAVATVSGLAGCDEGEVAIGAGLVAIGAGAYAIGSDDDDDYYDNHYNGGYNHGYYYDQGPQYGYYDNYDCYNNYYGGANCNVYYNHGYRSTDVTAELRKKETAKANPVTQKWAKRFELSEPSADHLLRSLVASRHGDAQAIRSLGFNDNDVKRMADFKMPSDQSIQTVAAKLGQQPAQTSKMVRDLLDNGRADLANSNGRIWTECKRSGKWKTPQNMSCSETWYTGCSPETGATMCVPK